jgi:hypothetical protein
LRVENVGGDIEVVNPIEVVSQYAVDALLRPLADGALAGENARYLAVDIRNSGHRAFGYDAVLDISDAGRDALAGHGVVAQENLELGRLGGDWPGGRWARSRAPTVGSRRACHRLLSSRRRRVPRRHSGGRVRAPPGWRGRQSFGDCQARHHASGGRRRQSDSRWAGRAVGSGDRARDGDVSRPGCAGHVTGCGSRATSGRGSGRRSSREDSAVNRRGRHPSHSPRGA